jgi:hypothetical protein
MEIPRGVHEDESHHEAQVEYDQVVKEYAEARKLLTSTDPEKQSLGISRLDSLHERNLIAQSKLNTKK